MTEAIRRTVQRHRSPHWSLALTYAVLAFLLLQTVHAIGAGSPSGAILLPRGADRTVDVSTLTGQTYLQAMKARGTGIFDKTDTDDGAAVTIASADDTVSDVNQFNAKVKSQVFGMFKTGETGFHAVIANISGKSFSPQTVRNGIRPFITSSNLKPGANANIAVDASADMALLASGSGTLVQIDGSNYFYNVGYQKPVVKSGRSYAVASGRALLDPSDRDYLTEMGNYLDPATTSDSGPFYTAILKVLTNCDPAGYSALSPGGQAAATDFLAIYTAEMDRHIMVNLAPSNHPWEIDLAEVTLLTSYGAASGMVMKNGALVPGKATDYFGVGTNGSGIGETRASFTKLAKRITSYESASGHHPALVNAIMTLTPITDHTVASAVNGDVFRRFLMYMSRTEFETKIQGHSNDYINAMLALLQQIKADNAEITQYVKAHP